MRRGLAAAGAAGGCGAGSLRCCGRCGRARVAAPSLGSGRASAPCAGSGAGGAHAAAPRDPPRVCFAFFHSKLRSITRPSSSARPLHARSTSRKRPLHNTVTRYRYMILKRCPVGDDRSPDKPPTPISAQPENASAPALPTCFATGVASRPTSCVAGVAAGVAAAPELARIRAAAFAFPKGGVSAP